MGMCRNFSIFFVVMVLSLTTVYSTGVLSAGNLICGAGSTGACPTTGSECSGSGGVCNYQNCSCYVSSSQAVASNIRHYFKSLVIPSGVTVTIANQASGGGREGNGANGPGANAGGSGGTGGYSGASGGRYGGGGGGARSGCIPSQGGIGGSNSGGGGGGADYSCIGWGSTNGASGGGIIVFNASNISIAGTINANGGTSTGCSWQCTTGGGGGGGNVILNGANVNISGGTINVNGGGSGSGWLTGGGGGGGFVGINYNCTYTPGTYSTAGGSPGNSVYGNGGFGAAGASGAVVPTKTGSCPATCGASGQTCCANNVCNSGLTCQSGTCQTAANSITLFPGWDMVSVTDANSQNNCTLVGPVWHWEPSQNNYIQVSDFAQMTPGLGYWIKIDTSCQLTLGPSQLIASYPQLNAGWNMIGGTSSSVNFSIVSGNCSAVSGPWRYDPQSKQYSNSQTLDPGFGYWLKVANDCNLGAT